MNHPEVLPFQAAASPDIWAGIGQQGNSSMREGDSSWEATPQSLNPSKVPSRMTLAFFDNT